MNKTRLAQLIDYLEKDPEDPFLIYAIAIEYQKSDLSKALSYFEKLLEEHQHYLPAYYHAAALLASLDQRERAAATYEKGISLAKQQDDQHTLRELKSAYEEFLFEGEE